MPRPLTLSSLTPGVNVDLLNIQAGMNELSKCGWPCTDVDGNKWTRQVVLYSLQRWARGEEEAAERGAIDPSFYGIDLTSWRRVLAAAMAGANP